MNKTEDYHYRPYTEQKHMTIHKQILTIDNLTKMDQFKEKYKLPQCTQFKINSLKEL